MSSAPLVQDQYTKETISKCTTQSEIKKITILDWPVAQQAKLLFLTPASHMSAGVESWLLCFQSSFLLMWLGRQGKMVQVLGSMPLTWQTKMAFLATGFGLAQSWLLCPFERWVSRWKVSQTCVCVCRHILSVCVCVCPSLSACQINKSFVKNNFIYNSIKNKILRNKINKNEKHSLKPTKHCWNKEDPNKLKNSHIWWFKKCSKRQHCTNLYSDMTFSIRLLDSL